MRQLKKMFLLFLIYLAVPINTASGLLDKKTPKEKEIENTIRYLKFYYPPNDYSWGNTNTKRYEQGITIYPQKRNN